MARPSGWDVLGLLAGEPFECMAFGVPRKAEDMHQDGIGVHPDEDVYHGVHVGGVSGGGWSFGGGRRHR